MNKLLALAACSAILLSSIPSSAIAQTVVKKTPRKYDKLLTVVESFAKLNAQIEIREKEYAILAPFVQETIFYADGLKNICDPKCIKSVNNYYPKLRKMMDALAEAHRRYQAMTPNITDRNATLMSEIKRVAFVAQPGRDRFIASLNQLDLENLYHYKAYATTYHSADSAMLSLAASSDLTTIISSFATTTDRLAKMGRGTPSANAAIMNLKNKIPDIRTRLKTLEDRRKALVCTATLSKEYVVEVHCTP